MLQTMLKNGPFAQTIFMMAAAQAAADNSPRRGKVRSPRRRARRASRRRMEAASRRANRCR